MRTIWWILAGVALFGGGFAAGYYARKKSEVRVEITECTEEELAAMASQTASEAPQSSSGVDIEEEINKRFTASEEPSEGIGNGQKIAYFRQWKAEEARESYDTRTKEDPEDPVTVDENGFDREFMDDIRTETERPPIETGTIEDWNRWVAEQDGEYEAIELRWYDADDIVCDDHDEELERTEQYIGFNIRKRFETERENTTGDPDVRILINHRHKAVYYIKRIHGSWSDKKRMESYGGEEEDDENEDSVYERFKDLRGPVL